MERRQSHRLYTNLPIEYRAFFDEEEIPLASRAMMKNISSGGAYLESDTPPSLKQGQVVHFTITSVSDQPADYHLAAKGFIHRIEQPAEGACLYGMAVQFLSGLFISYP